MIRLLKAHFPLLRTLFVLIALILCIGLALSAFQQKDNPIVKLEREDWQWAPAGSFDENRSPESGWRDNTYGDVIPSHIYWIRIPLPKFGFTDPQLLIMQTGSLKAYDGKEVFYSYQLTDRRVNSGVNWKMVEVPLPAPGYVDLLVRYGDHYPITAYITMGNKADLLNQILNNDLDNIILGTLLIFSGFITLGLFSTKRDKLYLFFALLAFSGGFTSLVRNLLLQVIWDNPRLGYFHDICLPLATFAFIGILKHVFPNSNPRTIRFMFWLMFADTLVTTLFSLVNPSWYYTYMFQSFGPLFTVVFVAVSWTLWSAYRSKRDLESIWMLAGFTSLSAISVIHVYRFIGIMYVPDWINERILWVHRLPNDLLFWGLFAFVVCLIRVIMYRYTAMNRQLLEFNRSLEHVVHTRTQQLQERTEQLETAHAQLGASMRENAEALADAMILEERHRITGSVHDTVGHTLSATIIQLEAAKRLIAKDHSLAEAKLEASQGLVRRGLEDIRQSVRLLREDASYYDLHGSIGALIRETEHSTGCQVHNQIDALPSSLSTLQKRIVFQTLQEGLRFGIKHGRRAPCQFRFTLVVVEDSLRMELVHLDEHSYTARDLDPSLHAIVEHATLIGGKIRAERENAGFVLALSLPLVKADHWVI